MTQKWTISGDYVEACNCDVACQCVWLEPPDDDVCTVSLAWHIREGNYGDVDLSGLSVGMLISTEEGVMFDPETEWDVVLMIDETADDDQREAIEDIYFGRAGGIWEPVADTHVRSGDVAVVPIDFSRDGDEYAVEIGDAVTMAAHGAVGFNEEVGTVSPHPLTESTEVQTGKSTAATVSYGDGEFEWDVSGNNAYLGDFELANS
ncbi:DUF1326 domain-containing protein [Haloarcula nitratireducens]|uniref:DUF1326 domain-containing protein n=1 Tax=Haloarcula nitratireducens TaxID=2487749 RepID=A0AAW4P7N3_9EURY|nr:DUF1326 domain-containing protein [Halomicroarcula nitratireducens]MBX0294051.1 DUF1326 domain-containing protein [Halomicroarcula nitratireducens]